MAIKFCAQREHFAHEKLFYDNRAALEGVPATKHVAELVDAIDGVATGLPPALVFECGDFTLQVRLTLEPAVAACSPTRPCASPSLQFRAAQSDSSGRRKIFQRNDVCPFKPQSIRPTCREGSIFLSCMHKASSTSWILIQKKS